MAVSFLSLIDVSMRALLCTALLPALCARAAAGSSSIAMFTINTAAADLKAVFFCILNRIRSDTRHSFKKRGFLDRVPCFLLSRLPVCQGIACFNAVCQGVKVLSPDIFGLG